MKVQHLRYFVAAVDHGGVTRAAERLRMTQPAVSAGLKALEDDLGCALFERDGGRLRPTPAGRRLHRRAVEILRQCDLARAEVRTEARPPALRLGVASSLPDRVLTALAAALAGRAGPPVLYRVGPAARMAAWLKHGRVAAALTALEAPPPAGAGRALLTEPFVCAVAPGHRFAAAGTVALADLAGEPLVARAACEGRAAAAALFRARGVATTVAAVAESDAAALALVRGGAGVALVPRSLAGPGLCAVTVDGLDLRRTVALLWGDGGPADGLEEAAAIATATAVATGAFG
ncbi:LysR family transcriptional regulator [Azospirillum sp. ST 5-10]|uniref:LysR family transcriptional regulator n=1 Tax=unclassified Azospirillum TaxID=2630922 RepID=UPI003F4A3B25